MKKDKIKARKRVFIDTNTKPFEIKKFKERYKWNWRDELGKELSDDDIKNLGIDY